MKSLLKIAIPTLLIAVVVGVYANHINVIDVHVQYGFSGEQVEAVQRTLRQRGMFDGEISGYFGPETERAVRAFQEDKGLRVNGIADRATLQALGVEVSAGGITATQANINLLARMISAEGRGEPYEGQVAIGAVIMNRIRHPSFPDTLAGVLYEDGAFTALVDGQFNEPISESAFSAARDAINGWDPSGGALFYFNPDKTTNRWMRTRPVVAHIGAHLFMI
ncbi:MAG: spore cortex-lytic enzyme [Oscillospiraceae bacterium]|nr:spore cortex-lytic enzyme [Oscillospiraceae bacterium]